MIKIGINGFGRTFVSAMPTDIGIPTARSTSADILEP